MLEILFICRVFFILNYCVNALIFQKLTVNKPDDDADDDLSDDDFDYYYQDDEDAETADHKSSDE